MAVSKVLRFSVFKRDGFTCQYCGRKTPSVILEADHIVPVSGGGRDEIENLITSCFDCNRGKGAVPLGVLPDSVDPHDRAVAIAEREMQLREYNEVRRQQREREDREIKWFYSEWGRLLPWIDRDEAPSEVTLRRHLGVLSIYDLAEAIAVVSDAVERGRVDYSGAVPYFCGVVRNKAEA